MKMNTIEKRETLILELIVLESLITRYTLNRQWKKRKEVVADFNTKYELLMNLERDVENQLEDFKKGGVVYERKTF